GQPRRDRQDARVVVGEPEPVRQDARIGVVQLDPERSTLVALGSLDRDRLVQPAVPQAEVVERAEGLPCEVPELGVVTLDRKSGDADDGEYDLVLGVAVYRPRVGAPNAGV